MWWLRILFLLDSTVSELNTIFSFGRFILFIFSYYPKCHAELGNFAFFSLYGFREVNFFWIFVFCLKTFDEIRDRYLYPFIDFFSFKKQFLNLYCFTASRSCYNSKSCSKNYSINCFQLLYVFYRSRENFSKLYHFMCFSFYHSLNYFSNHSFCFHFGFKLKFNTSSFACLAVETIFVVYSWIHSTFSPWCRHHSNDCCFPDIYHCWTKRF